MIKPIYAVLIAVVMLAAVCVAVAVSFGNTQLRTMELMAKTQRDVCERLQWDLEAIVRSPSNRFDLHERMAYHHFDESLLRLCFGTPPAVTLKDADACWVLKGADDCYLDSAKALLDAYRHR